MIDKKKSLAIDEFFANQAKVPIIDFTTAKPSEIINWAVQINEAMEKFYNFAYSEGYKDASNIKI